MGDGYNPGTEVQSSQWKSSSSPHAKNSMSVNIRHPSDVNCAFHFGAIVRVGFIPRNTTVNSEYFKDLLEHVRNNVHRKRPEKRACGFISIMITPHITHCFC